MRNTKNLKLRTSVERPRELSPAAAGPGRRRRGQGSELPHEKRLIASLSRHDPENLSRTFGTLRPYGVLVEGARVRISLADDLRKLAKPSPLIDDPTF